MSVCISLLVHKMPLVEAVEWVWMSCVLQIASPASIEAGNPQGPCLEQSVVGALHPAVTSCLCCLLFSSLMLCEAGAVKTHGKECKRATGKRKSLWKKIPVQPGKGKLPRVF